MRFREFQAVRGTDCLTKQGCLRSIVPPLGIDLFLLYSELTAAPKGMSDGGNMAQAGTGAACGGMLCSVTLPCRWRDQSDASSGAEGICLITQLAFPMAAAAQGVVNAATQQPVPAQIAIANANTVPYTLGALESAQSVAERFGISVAELRKLNQFRTFARGFDNVHQGDELDVPAQVSENNLTPPPGNSMATLSNR